MSITVLSISENSVQYVGNLLVSIYKKSLKQYLNTQVITASSVFKEKLILYLLHKIFTKLNDKACLLPKIEIIYNLTIAANDQQFPPIDEITKTGIILKILAQEKAFTHLQQTYIAQMIGNFLNDFYTYTYTKDYQDLTKIITKNFLNEWIATVKFLNKFLQLWQAELIKLKRSDATLYNLEKIKNLAQLYSINNSAEHVILCGLDINIPAINHLINSVKKLANGHVIIDNYLITKNNSLQHTHPNYSHLFLLKDFELPNIKKSVREELITQICSDSILLYDSKLTNQALKNIKLIEATSLPEEAEMIITILIEEISNDQTQSIAIITPDKDLLAIIQQKLSCFDKPANALNSNFLMVKKIISYLLQVLEVGIFIDKKDCVNWLNLLKNPLTNLQYENKEQFKKTINALEIEYLRNCQSSKEINQFLNHYNNLIKSFNTIKESSQLYSLYFWLTEHIKLVKIFSSQINLTFIRQCNKNLYKLLNDLMNCSSVFPKMQFQEYKILISQYLNNYAICKPTIYDNLILCSPQEALYRNFDTAFVCGLTEEIWLANSNKYKALFNREIALNLNLPSFHAQISQATKMFAKAMMHQKVYLTYCKSRQNNPVSPASWLLKLTAICQRHDLNMNLLFHPVKNWLHLLKQTPTKVNYQLPNPVPSIETRPDTLSVSALEKLFNNPYSLYAEKILKLKPLKAIEANLGNSEYGTWIHRILQYAVFDKNYDCNIIKNISLKYLPQGIEKNLQEIWYYKFNCCMPWILDILKNNQAMEMYPEKELKYVVNINNDAFTIIGKADRIDKLSNKNYAIIDYKTGNIPSKTEVFNLEKPQLPLLALLYEKIFPNIKVTQLTYIALKDKKIISFDVEDLLQCADKKLKTILEYYCLTNASYPINLLNSLKNSFNDYIHLERIQEWLNNKV